MSEQVVVAVNGSAAMEYLKESSNLHFFSTSYFVLFHTEQSQAILALVTLSAWKILSFLLSPSLRPTLKTGRPLKSSLAQTIK